MNLDVRLPVEMGQREDLVAEPETCMYGTNGAGAIWETNYGEALAARGFTQGVASPS